MAKTSSIQRNLKRIRLSKKFYEKRKKLKMIIKNKKLPLVERFEAQLKLAKRFIYGQPLACKVRRKNYSNIIT